MVGPAIMLAILRLAGMDLLSPPWAAEGSWPAKGEKEESRDKQAVRRCKKSLWPKREGTLNVTREPRASVCLA